MTPQAYIEWLDKQIEWNRHLNGNASHGDSIAAARRDLLKEAREKFLTIQYTPTQTENK